MLSIRWDTVVTSCIQFGQYYTRDIEYCHDDQHPYRVFLDDKCVDLVNVGDDPDGVTADHCHHDVDVDHGDCDLFFTNEFLLIKSFRVI